MAAKIYAWYASLGPWAIPAAAATVAAAVAAIAAIGKVTARETGGIIGLNGPELFLGGERGPEVIAPPSDFRDWANANQNLGYNLGAHGARVAALQTQASSYTAGARVAAASYDARGTTVDMRGSTVMGTSVESARKIGRAVKRAQDDYARRHN